MFKLLDTQKQHSINHVSICSWTGISGVSGDILLTSIKQDIWVLQDCHVNCRPNHVYACMYVQILRTYLWSSSPPSNCSYSTFTRPCFFILQIQYLLSSSHSKLYSLTYWQHYQINHDFKINNIHLKHPFSFFFMKSGIKPHGLLQLCGVSSVVIIDFCLLYIWLLLSVGNVEVRYFPLNFLCKTKSQYAKWYRCCL